MGKTLDVLEKEHGGRLAKFASDPAVNHLTGDVDWTRAGPFICITESGEKDLIHLIEYAPTKTQAVVSRG